MVIIVHEHTWTLVKIIEWLIDFICQVQIQCTDNNDTVVGTGVFNRSMTDIMLLVKLLAYVFPSQMRDVVSQWHRTCDRFYFLLFHIV